MPDKDQQLTENELEAAVKKQAQEFDTRSLPTNYVPRYYGKTEEEIHELISKKRNSHSNFPTIWETWNVFAMSKEIPAMATVRDLRDLRLEDIGLLAFLGSLPDDHDGDAELLSTLLGRTDSDIHLSYDRLRRCGLLVSSKDSIWHARMKAMVV